MSFSIRNRLRNYIATEMTLNLQPCMLELHVSIILYYGFSYIIVSSYACMYNIGKSSLL